MTRGKFVTIEGCEGAGKSTQVRLLCEWLDSLGIDYVFTREPGGCKTSEAIREIILSNDYAGMDAGCEALLYAGARLQNLRDTVEPALAAGKLVICDRYVDSSFAYQGYARGLGFEFVESINRKALEGHTPDLTLFLDIRPAEAFQRKHGADKSDRMECEGLAFHEKVYEGYKEAQRRFERIVSVDCGGSKEETAENIKKILTQMGIVEA
ncbi:MAG: dTMP kinase [Clostridia bacterium]|nr:dTMP kinase [Clostridia bacterium]